MTSAARVSVIIPTYNRAEWLVEAIDSVLNQSFRDCEIIVADDGSTDDTAERLATLGVPVRHVPLEHSGRPGHVRNRGIAVARGQYIAFLDDDDLWQPDKLTRQVELMDRDESLGFVYSDICFVYPDGSISNPILLPRHKQASMLFDRLITDSFIYPSTVVVRRQLLNRIGMFDESLAMAEDYDLWLRLAYTTEADCVPEPLVLIRRHASNISQQRETLSYQNAISVLERLLETRPLSLRQRLRARVALSRRYTHVGLSMLRVGNTQEARRHFVHSLRLSPLQRRAWTALKQSDTMRRQ